VALVCALAYAASASSAGAAIIKQISPKVKTWVRQATFWGGARLRREGKRRLKAGGWSFYIFAKICFDSIAPAGEPQSTK
jgi:hypothetical protein